MECKKKPYQTKEEAENFSRYQKVLRPEKGYQRAYPCPICHLWHLSSKKARATLPFQPNIDPLAKYYT